MTESNRPIQKISFFTSIKTKLGLLIISLVFLVLLLNVFLSNRILTNHLTSELLDRSIVNSQSLLTTLADPFFTNNSSRIIETIFDEKYSHTDIAFIAVFDEQGQIVAHTILDTSRFPLDQISQAQHHEQAHIERYSDEDIIEINLDFNYNKGHLLVGYYKKSTDALLTRLNTELLLLLLVPVFATFIFAYLAAGFFTKPVKRLTAVARDVAQGDLAQRATVTSRDEVGYLSQVFNRMLNNIQKSQAELFSEKEKSQAIIESVGDGLFVIDKRFRIISMNKAAEKMSGFHKHEAFQKDYRKIFKFVQERDRKENFAFVEKAMTTGKITHMDNNTILIDRNGKEIAVSDSAAPVKNNSGKIQGVVVVLHDVSKERAIERVKSDFITAGSHQLRTPLSAIQWTLEMGLSGEKGKLNPDQKELIENAYQATLRMKKLVDSLLHISKIEAEQIVLKREEIDLVALLRDVVKDFSHVITEKKQHVTIKRPNAPVIIQTDAELLQEVISNLVSNAVKFTPTKGKIELQAAMTASRVQISIKDSGIGIAKSDQAQVFKKFFRTSSAYSIDTEGSGLGLYISQRLTQVLKGTITFTSEEKKGTTFIVELPLK